MSSTAAPDPERGAQLLGARQLLSSDDVARALTRMAHEIVERNHGLRDVVIVGIQSGGSAIAERIAQSLASIEGQDVAHYALDVAFYRDDIGTKPLKAPAPTTLDQDLSTRTVVLVDDVLYTGRTIRAALLALGDWGRPAQVQLAVLVDRGHRELPIRPDFVGKNLPTSLNETVRATLEGVWIGSGEPS